ncbi:MAG: sulfotransferase [Coleofasciculus sp.]|uniref:sulfotransferase n=1 Tax=Coleofasciculus sp. TaxID=3100458 RepID=UPI003A3A7ED2
MSLSPEYFRYLEHFGKTVTVQELSENPHLPNLIALRHDVDYDLDLALEMSYWEHERGIRATYYLLHTASYWHESRFLDKCLQIQDFGHEVGLHLNSLSQWIRGDIEDVALSLEKLMASLREVGIRVSGVSTHGDRLCYEWGFINYWCFAELKPTDPSLESGLSAEGIPVNQDRFQISYPESGQLIVEGKQFKLWSVSMEKLGLTYEAVHVPHEFYYTDSGGGWHRSTDPLQSSLKSGRHQVLMHPLYWRGEKKIYFFLSTARSGSKWLANFLDQGTSLTANHEFTLNHRFQQGELIEEKHTAEGFTNLVTHKDEAKQLCLESRTWIEELPGDYGEANVYLERFPEVMTEVFPDATFIHIHRNPRQVVRSIMNRDWYDTPDDTRHPIMAVQGWREMGQFEKACWYVRKTNETLFYSCQHRLAFELMVKDLTYLRNQLRSWGIPVFPRLAAAEFEKKINVNYSDEFPEYENWSSQQKVLFAAICEPIGVALGYNSVSKAQHRIFSYLEGLLLKFILLKWRVYSFAKKLFKSKSGKSVCRITFGKDGYQGYSVLGCRVQVTENGIEIVPEGGRNAHLLIGGGQWYKLESKEGWKSQVARYYRGDLDVDVGRQGGVQLFCLMYDAAGKLMAKRSLGQIRQDEGTFKFAFRPKSNAERFNLAIYMSVSQLPDKVKVKRFELDQLSL